MVLYTVYQFYLKKIKYYSYESKQNTSYKQFMNQNRSQHYKFSYVLCCSDRESLLCQVPGLQPETGAQNPR